MDFVIVPKVLCLLAGAVLFSSLAGAEKETLNITTLSGHRYENVEVERVGTVGIDISYIDADGAYCLKGIPFTDLSRELQNKYGYDPRAAAEYRKQLARYRNSSAEKGINEERERLEKVAASLRSDFQAGRQIKETDLSFAVQGFRRLVELEAVANTRSGGTLAKVTSERGGESFKPLETYIIIDGIKLQPGVGGWSGFIYPTGLKAKAGGRENVPVFCDSLEDALKLIHRYFEMYSSFAASGAGTGDAEVPEQTEEKQDITINYYEDDGFDGYYMGGSYWPVWWWHNRHPRPPHPRPPHPKPPHPRPPHPKPPHPKPDHRPVRPPERPGDRPEYRPAVKPEGIRGGKTPQRSVKVNSIGRQVPVERCGNFSRVNQPQPGPQVNRIQHIHGTGIRGGRR